MLFDFGRFSVDVTVSIIQRVCTAIYAFLCTTTSPGKEETRHMLMNVKVWWRCWTYGVGFSNACLYVVACDCHQHSTSCVYNKTRGYGVCQNCVHNTEGDQCGDCTQLHYRNTSVDLSDQNACVGMSGWSQIFLRS